MADAKSSQFLITIQAVDKATAVMNQVNARVSAMTKPIRDVGVAMKRFSDASGLTRVGKAFSDVAGHAFRLGKSIVGAIGPLGALASAASAAGFMHLVDAFAEAGLKLSQLAQRAKMGVAEMSSLQGAFTLLGSSAEAGGEGMKALGDNLTNAVTGNAAFVVAMNSVGVSIRDASGHMRTADDLLPEIANKIAKIKDPTLQARLAVAAFGAAGEAMLPALQKGAAGIEEARQRAAKHSGDMVAAARASVEFSAATADLKLSMGGLGNAITTAVMPYLGPMLKRLSDWVDAHRDDIAEFFRSFTKWISELDWTAFGEFVANVGRGIIAVRDGFGVAKKAVSDFMDTPIGGIMTLYINPLTVLSTLLEVISGRYDTARHSRELFENVSTGAAELADRVRLGAGLVMAGAGVAAGNVQAGAGVVAGNVSAGAGVVAGNVAAGATAAAQAAGLGSGGATGGGGAAGGGTRGAHGDSISPGEAIAQLMREGGWSHAQAAGIVAGLHVESGLNTKPGGSNDRGAAQGMAQWHKERREAIEDHFKKKLSDMTAAEQITAVNWELTQGGERHAGNLLREEVTPYGSGKSASENYERPGERVAQAALRGRIAQGFMSIPLPSGPDANIGNGSGAAGGAGANGRVDVNINHTNPPPGSSVTARSSGDGIGQPVVMRAMAGAGG